MRKNNLVSISTATDKAVENSPNRRIHMETIFTRRSIRSYTAEPVAAETVDRLLAAAMAAPSAGNEQPWHFIVVRDRAALEAVTLVNPYSQMLKEAPLAILVCADPGRGKYPPHDYWVLDCAAATQNILLAAAALGLGTCWLGTYPDPERVEGVRRIFAIPHGIVPFAVVAVGHPARKPAPADRFDRSRIRYEKW
jgi:nitroreductase